MNKTINFRLLLFAFSMMLFGYISCYTIANFSSEKEVSEIIKKKEFKSDLDKFLYEKKIENYKDTLSKTRHENIEITYNLERERAANRTLIESIRAVNRHLDGIRPLRDSTVYRPG
jgi:hypothetical protein